MLLTIVTDVGVGDFRFGMKPSQIRAIAQSPFHSLRKTKTTKFPLDAFVEMGVHVHYKVPGLCQAIEMSGVAQPMFRDHYLIGTSFAKTEKWLRSIDPLLEVDDAGVTSKALGIGLYSPGYSKSKSVLVEGVIVFEHGYYG